MRDIDFGNFNQAVSNINVLLDNLIRKRLSNNVFDKDKFLSILKFSLFSEDKNLRKVAVKLIRRLRLWDFGEYLKLLLNDPDATVRAVTILALAQMKDSDSFEKIKDLYFKDVNAVKIAALMYFGVIENSESRNMLLEALNTNNEDLKENAFQGLAWHTNYQDIDLIKDVILKDIGNYNLVCKYIKSLSTVNNPALIVFLEDLILKREVNDNIVLTSIYILYLKNITKYLLLADSILIKYLKNSDDINKHYFLYEIASNILWETKKINSSDQYKMSKLISDFSLYYKEREIKYIVRTIKNLNPVFHNLILKIMERNNLTIDTKSEIMSFLVHKNVDKNLRVLMFEFLNDSDLYIRELALFNLLSINFTKSDLVYVEEYLYRYQELHLKLIILAIIYLNS